MIVVPLDVQHLAALPELMSTGHPFIRVRSQSDYWAYAHLFSSTCPVIVEKEGLIAAMVAFRSQDHPAEIYVQDVVVHPAHRGRGAAGLLLGGIRAFAHEHGCTRIYLTSEPENRAAHRAWTRLGFVNVPGDRTVAGVSVTTDFKGPGRDRAVYELRP